MDTGARVKLQHQQAHTAASHPARVGTRCEPTRDTRCTRTQSSLHDTHYVCTVDFIFVLQVLVM